MRRARNAGYQARWRAKRDALVRSHPEAAERALLAAAEGSDRSAEERAALADRLQDLAMRHFHAMHRLNRLATKIREG